MDPVIRIDGRGVVYLGRERYMAGEEYADDETVMPMILGVPSERMSIGELVVAWELFRNDPGYQPVLEPETAMVEQGVRVATTKRKEYAPW